MRRAILPLLALLWLHAHAQQPCRSVELSAAHGITPDPRPVVAAPYRQGAPATIPVVVHVVWNTPSENIPDAAIHALIDRMHADLMAQNSDLSFVRPAFAGVVGEPAIGLCLATLDPQGQPTSGITRTFTTETWFDPATEADDMKSPPKGTAPWDPSSYLNIWVCDIASGAGGNALAGYAYLPFGGMAGSAVDGPVLDAVLAFNPGSRTATHELGHYLGLLHPFGSDCSDADGLSDTPPADSPTFSCTNPNLQKCGTLNQYENFMDLGPCRVLFTLQQAAVMNDVLSTLRPGLTTNPACPSSAAYCIPTSPNGTDQGDLVDGVVLADLVNTGSGAIGGPSYSDLTHLLATVQRGTTAELIITAGPQPEVSCASWLDLDGDHTFAPDEWLGAFTTADPFGTGLIAFTVPWASPVDTTRLRVRCVRPQAGEPVPTDPCFPYTFGETEDYAIAFTTGVGVAAQGAQQAPPPILLAEGALFLTGAADGPSVRVELIDTQGRTHLRSGPLRPGERVPIDPFPGPVLIRWEQGAARGSIRWMNLP